MLDERDVLIIKDIVEGAIEKNNYILRDEMREMRDGLRDELRGEMQGMKDELRGEMRGMEEKLRGEIHSAIEENNELIFDEMERYYKMTHREIEALDKKVTEISDYYRIRKMEDDTSGRKGNIKSSDQPTAEILQISGGFDGCRSGENFFE